MLRSLKAIRDYVLQAEDGKIGHCDDFLFDDRFWTVRYMVAETGDWLTEQKVLISPISLGQPDWDTRLFPVLLTKKQIEGAPEIDKDAPVSRRHEISWYKYYGWPHYWGGTYAWGTALYPTELYDEDSEENETSEADLGDDHLRSVHEVTDYRIQAKDAEVGHVEDFIVDDETWIIQYVVVDTRNWLPGKKVLVAPAWMDSVDWAERKVRVSMTSEEIKNSPEYDPAVPVSREYEVRLYDFYGRPKYWE